MTRWLAVPVVALIALAMGALGMLGDPATWGVDAWSYWSYDPTHPYAIGVWGTRGAYQYAPPFAQALMPLQSVPWDWFLLGWTVLGSAALVWLTGWLSVPLALAPMVTREVWYGNVHLLMAAAVVAGFRRPWAWAFVLLTKVTPGVCLLWFVARRDWRSLRVALGATAVVAAVSWLVAPWLWSEWVAVLADLSSRGGSQVAALQLGPLWLRVVVAGAVAYGAGLAGLRWPVAIAVVIALPSVWFHGLSIVVALVPLAAMDRRDPLPAMVSRARPRWTTGRRAPRSARAPGAPPA